VQSALKVGFVATVIMNLAEVFFIHLRTALLLLRRCVAGCALMGLVSVLVGSGGHQVR
jgi:hypothetical protein